MSPDPVTLPSPHQPLASASSPNDVARLEVRAPADDIERRACRMILPEAFASGATPNLLVAITSAPFRVVGAAAHKPATFEGAPAWRVLLHVVRNTRRRRIGTGLMRAMEARSRAAGVPALIVSHSSDDQDTAGFLAARGFRRAFRLSRYECDLAEYRAEAHALRDRLVARGRVPAGARVVDIAAAPPDRLRELLALDACQVPHPDGLTWADALNRAPVRAMSRALMLDGTVIGAMLLERDGAVVDVLWRVVAPEHRLGWANILLSAAVWDHLFAQGVRTVRFAATTDTPDTRHVMARYRCERATHTDYAVKPVTAQDPS